MLSVPQFLSIVDEETKILKHLHGKLPKTSADYRPTDGQRSTIELMRYLSMCGIAGTQAMLDGHWDSYDGLKSRADAMTWDEFPAALDRQGAEIRNALQAIPEGDYMTRETKYLTGEMFPLGLALVMAPLRWLSAYRLQLFLYAKAAGLTELGTANAWAGRDPKKA